MPSHLLLSLSTSKPQTLSQCQNTISINLSLRCAVTFQGHTYLPQVHSVSMRHLCAILLNIQDKEQNQTG